MAAPVSAWAKTHPQGTDRAGDMIERPVFLVGSERSGTTLLRLMLDHHPQIAFFFEFEYSVSRMPEASGWPDLGEYYEYLGCDRIFRSAGLRIDKGLDYPHLINDFLRQKRDRDGKELVGAVVHYEYDRLLRIWPDARFIHIVRDGRDVSRSVIANGLAGNMYTAARTWVRAEKLWSEFSRGLPASRWIELRYESLVSDPEGNLARICQFMGVPFHPAMLSYPETSTYGPPSPTKVYDWKVRASRREVQLAEAQIGEILAERGYELSGHPPVRVSRVMRAMLGLQDRFYRMSYRRRTYGTALWLTDLLARRLRILSVARALRRGMDAIDESLLK